MCYFYIIKLEILLPLKTRIINKYIGSVCLRLFKEEKKLSLNEGKVPNLNIFFLLYLFFWNFFIHIIDLLADC